MIKTLKEAFGIDQPFYMMGIAYEVMYSDDNEEGKKTRKGWMIPYQETDITEIDSYATKYLIEPRKSDDSRKNWDGGAPYTDGVSGDETYYTLFVKNIDGSDLSQEEFNAINEKISEEEGEDEMGRTINPLPPSLHY